MATKSFDVIVHNADGIPTDLMPSFSYYHVFDSSGSFAGAQPSIPAFVKISSEPGRYTFAVTLQEGQFLRAQIEKTFDPSKYEYLRIDYSDLLDIATLQSGIDETKAAALLARKMLTNKIVWNPETAIMDIYDDNGTTVLARLSFTDENNSPSVVSPLNRNQEVVAP